MNEFTIRIKKGFFLLICLAFAMAAKAQIPTYELYITNEVLVSPTIYEFDIFLLRTGSTSLELATVQFGLGLDTSTASGGTFTPLIVGNSEMLAAQVPVSVNIGASFQTIGGKVYRFYNCAARAAPGSTFGTIISNVNSGCNHPGTRLARFRLTNSIPFTANSNFNHVFSTSTASGRTNTLVNAYIPPLTIGSINTPITVTANHLGYNSNPTCDANITLNACVTPSLATSQVNISCVPNNPTGSATVTPTGGSSPYTYLWTAGAQTTATATGLAAGTYTVTVTATGGCTISTSVTITGNTTPPSVGASASPATICSGSSSTLTGSGADTYSWQPGSLTGTTVSVSPTSTTTYTVTGTTTATGCTASATVSVTVQNPITVNAGPPQSACVGETITLGGTITNASSGNWSGGNGNYPQGTAWNPGVTEYETVAADAPSVTLTLTSSNTCGTASDNMIVTVNPLPTITATTSISVCQGTTSFSIPYSATTGLPDHYELNPGSNPYPNFTQVQGTLPSPPSSIGVSIDGSAAPGVYFFELTVDNTTTTCMQNGVTTITLTVLANPTAGITNNSGTTVLSCTQTTINVTATGGTGYLWSGGATPSTAANSFTSAGTYTVTVTGANGCTATASIIITSNVTPPPVSASASPATICTGGSTTLTGSGASTYSWMPGSLTGTTVSVSPVSTTTYTVTGTDAGGCTATAIVTVTIGANPIILSAMKTDASFGGPTGTAGVTFSPGTCTISWSPGLETTSYIEHKPAGTYTATVTHPSGCTKVRSVIIN